MLVLSCFYPGYRRVFDKFRFSLVQSEFCRYVFWCYSWRWNHGLFLLFYLVILHILWLFQLVKGLILWLKQLGLDRKPLIYSSVTLWFVRLTHSLRVDRLRHGQCLRVIHHRLWQVLRLQPLACPIHTKYALVELRSGAEVHCDCLISIFFKIVVMKILAWVPTGVARGGSLAHSLNWSSLSWDFLDQGLAFVRLYGWWVLLSWILRFS